MIAHPFERAGLGVAPFRCVGVEHKVGPLIVGVEGGCTISVGSPGQPMGVCDYCGTGIADCYVIVSADKKRFVVGSDCVARTYGEVDLSVPSSVRVAIAKVAREKREVRAEAKREGLRQILLPLLADARAILAADPSLFVSSPHPMISGKTLRDYYQWLLLNSGVPRQIEICRKILEAVS